MYLHLKVFLLQETGLAIISMDALFGLPRKKSAGQSFHDPLNGQLFFLDQSNVDEYVETKSSANMKKLKVKKVNIIIMLQHDMH